MATAIAELGFEDVLIELGVEGLLALTGSGRPGRAPCSSAASELDLFDLEIRPRVSPFMSGFLASAVRPVARGSHDSGTPSAGRPRTPPGPELG